MPSQNPVERLFSEHPDLLYLRAVADEVEARATRDQGLPILRYQDTADNPRPLVPPGAAVLFVGRPGSRALLDIRRAFATSDRDLMNAVARTIYENLVERQPTALDQGVQQFVESGSSIDLAYRGVALVSNVFLPEDLDVAAFPMPYTGGALEDSAFQLTVRFKEGYDKAWLDAVLVINEPELTEMERAALELVSGNEVGIEIGRAALCYAITAITVFIVVAGATYACPGVKSLDHLDDETIRELTPSMTARELLALRRQALEHRN